MKKVTIDKPNPHKRDRLTVYEIESKLSEEEKIAFIDELKDGVATYMVNLIQKWNDEKDTLKKENSGRPKKTSHKAWVNRSDSRPIMSRYDIGRYKLFGTDFSELSFTCPISKYGYSLEYSGKSVVHQWFHDLCHELEIEEQRHFHENDHQQVKLTKVREYAERFSMDFDNEEIREIWWNHENDVPEDRLDTYIEAFEKLEKYAKKLAKTLPQLQDNKS